MSTIEDQYDDQHDDNDWLAVWGDEYCEVVARLFESTSNTSVCTDHTPHDFNDVERISWLVDREAFEGTGFSVSARELATCDSEWIISAEDKFLDSLEVEAWDEWDNCIEQYAFFVSELQTTSTFPKQLQDDLLHAGSRFKTDTSWSYAKMFEDANVVEQIKQDKATLAYEKAMSIIR